MQACGAGASAFVVVLTAAWQLSVLFIRQIGMCISAGLGPAP
jgi:hypothetical protein